SPISSLPTLFDQTVSCSSSGQLENVPQATPNIEQLLEKQGNGEAGVNICNNDSLSISKSPPCKNSFGIENSLSASSEDPHSGCPSRSSSSLSFHSTPPPLPMLQQSPASLPLPGVQQVNGLARVAGSGLGEAASTVPMVDSLMGTLAGGQQMPINGILGNLNGAQAAQPPSALTQASGPPTLQLSTSLSSPLTEQQRHVLHQHEQQLQQLQQLLTSQPLNPEQQALVFQMMQQIQQKRELQRLQKLSMTSLLAATSAPLHSSTSALMTSQLNPSNALMAPQATPPLSTPGNSLLASGTGIPPVLTAQTNPFLNLQADGNTPKGTSNEHKASKKRFLPPGNAKRCFGRQHVSDPALASGGAKVGCCLPPRSAPHTLRVKLRLRAEQRRELTPDARRPPPRRDGKRGFACVCPSPGRGTGDHRASLAETLAEEVPAEAALEVAQLGTRWQCLRSLLRPDGEVTESRS
ncbi:PREDICTED: LOW QUALITY PROTEIN: protein AF-17-like, partial [Eurypyga helias]|uniref:LOW QUALITY PROTEIN: protein AF-17-like n=1 Tax=Eurypyga helias TaxID=54383 RepID=UPI0005286DF5